MIYKFDKENLVYKKTYKLLLSNIFNVVLLGCAVLLSIAAAKPRITEFVPTETTIIMDTTLVELTIIERIKSLPFKYPDIIIAQAKLESDHFSSPVFVHNNNIFGMRLAKQRMTLATGHNLKHATFKTIDDSIIDRLIYDSKYMSNLSRDQYFRFLDKLYAEGDGYSNLLKQMIRQQKGVW